MDHSIENRIAPASATVLSMVAGPERMGGTMDKLEAGKLVRGESILEVRVELVRSEPSIWRQLEVRGSLALNQVHQVLQGAFDWEDAHLHRFTPADPFASLRR